MTSPSKIFLVLPAYNEERALGQLLPDIARALKPLGIPYTIGVVDDGSRDGTAALADRLARELPIQLLRHEKNIGYGGSIKTGALWAIQNGSPEDVVITMDSDNTQSPAYIPALIQKLQNGSDVVTASYTMPGGQVHGVPFLRRIFSQTANFLIGARFRFPGIATYTNGFRAYRVGALQQAFHRYGDALVKETNFAGGTELFIKTVQAGARPGEIPFTLEYGRRGNDSKINIPRTISGYLKLLKP